MKLIVGLGNPGDEYEDTRHNVGFQIVDRLRSTVNGGEWVEEKKFQSVVSRQLAVDVLLAKPQTFMNQSGVSVSSLYTFYKIQNTNLYVVHDDLDLRLGEYKIQFGKGPKDHNGLLSIYEKLGNKDFWHVRIGIDNRHMADGLQRSERSLTGKEYVLQNFTEEEKTTLNEIMEKIITELVDLTSK